jgi:hypothetical protein
MTTQIRALIHAIQTLGRAPDALAAVFRVHDSDHDSEQLGWP